jgi:hypothetical protein
MVEDAGSLDAQTYEVTATGTAWAAPATISIASGVMRLLQCELYLVHHVPILNAHHICPESWWIAAGKPVSTPFKNLCPNCHGATHAAIDGIIRKLDIHLLPPRCVQLAQQAFSIAEANGLTPKLTL